ncbi:DUF1877 family protein [Salmonella enterica]
MLAFDPQILREENYLLVTDLPKVNIYKMWDYLHWALAGASFYNPPNNNPLSRAVAGTHVIDGKILYAAVTRNNELTAIVDALKNADRNTLQIKFFQLNVDEIDIYPGNWSRKQLGELFHCLMQEMDKLLSFYQRCLRNDSHVIIFIAE